ncbi:unnamed protein product [Rhizophagus irregularis]|nr:unnamed protein product [Rhizophagus irregularis]
MNYKFWIFICSQTNGICVFPFYLDTPSHTMGVGKELTELCSLGIREGDILRFKKKYTKLLDTDVKLDFKYFVGQVIKIDDNSRLLVNIIIPPYQSDFIQRFSGIVNSKAYKSLSDLEIDIIAHVAKHQCIMDLEQDHPKTKERIGQIIKELEIQHIIEESEYLQWENKLDEIKQAILEKQMPNINSNMQFEVLRNNVNLGNQRLLKEQNSWRSRDISLIVVILSSSLLLWEL